MLRFKTAFAAFALLYLCDLCNGASLQEVHETAQASAKANMAVVGQQPSAALASACERHFVQNNVTETVRPGWKRTSPFKTSLTFVTAQALIHAGKADLGKKLIAYYARFEGKNIFGLPASRTGICFFRVENKQARFETSCSPGGSCPYLAHVPWYDFN